MKIDVTAFIRELLFGHDCVIVPGFGGFIGNYTPARIDRNSGTFSPPIKQISFNRNLNNNDGLLIGKISESLNINYKDSRNFVEEYVTDLRGRLSKGEKIVLELIGSFYYNQEGNTQFEPDKDSNYLLGSYGLTSFKCLPIEGYDVRKRIVKYKENRSVYQWTLRKTLWRAAVIIPLVTIVTFASVKTDFFKGWVQETSMNPLALAEFENNKKAVEAAEFVTIAEPIEAPVADLPIVNVPEEVMPPLQVESTYILVAGSFKSQDNAKVLMKKLIEEGYAPELIEASNGFFRVSAMSVSNLGQAAAEKKKIEIDFPGTWIHKIK